MSTDQATQPQRAIVPAPAGRDPTWLSKLLSRRQRQISYGSIPATDTDDHAHTSSSSSARRPSMASGSSGRAAYVPRHAGSDFASMALPTTYSNSVAFRHVGPSRERGRGGASSRTRAAAAAAAAGYRDEESSSMTTPVTQHPSLFDGKSSGSTAATASRPSLVLDVEEEEEEEGNNDHQQQRQQAQQDTKSSSRPDALGTEPHQAIVLPEQTVDRDEGTKAWLAQTAAASSSSLRAPRKKAPNTTVWGRVASYIKPANASE